MQIITILQTILQTILEFIAEYKDDAIFILIVFLLPYIISGFTRVIKQICNLFHKHYEKIFLSRKKFQSKQEEKHFFKSLYIDWAKVLLAPAYCLFVFNTIELLSNILGAKYGSLLLISLLFILILVNIFMWVICNRLCVNQNKGSNYLRYNLILCLTTIFCVLFILLGIRTMPKVLLLYALIGLMGCSITEIISFKCALYKFHQLTIVNLFYYFRLITTFFILITPYVIIDKPSIFVCFLDIYFILWMTLVAIERIIIYRSNVLSYVEYEIETTNNTYKTTRSIYIINEYQIGIEKPDNRYIIPLLKNVHCKEIRISDVISLSFTQKRYKEISTIKIAIIEKNNIICSLYYHEKAFSKRNKNWMFFYLYKDGKCEVTVVHSSKVIETEKEMP